MRGCQATGDPSGPGVSGIGVVIPCHNAAPWLQETLDSLLGQSLPPDEILVVDDGSTDGSQVIAEGYGPEVRVISRTSGSAAKTRNFGADHVQGQALMFLDADDVLDPAALETLSAGLMRAPGGIALAPWRRLEQDGGGHWRIRPASCAPRRPGQDLLAAWLTGWYHPPCSVLWSRAALDRTGPWDAQSHCNDDGEMIMRALVKGIPVVEVRGGGAFYRRLPAQQASLSSTRRSTAGLESRLYVLEKIAALLEERGRLRRYRAALGEALDRVAADCGAAHRDLARRARATAARIAGPYWRRALRRPIAGAATRLARSRGAGLAGPAKPRPGHVRVRQGSGPAPLVSVILPVHDRADIVHHAIASVLGQSVRDLELLVVDDGSSDALDDALQRFRDPRLRLLRQPTNRGAAAARNLGLRAAAGRYLAFIDSDDCWLPGSLAARLKALETAPEEAGLVFGRLEHVTAGGRVRIEGTPPPLDTKRAMLERNLIVGTPGVMLRRRVLETVGLFDEGMPACEDYDYWLRVALRFGVVFVDRPLFQWHDASAAGPSGRLRRLSSDVAGNMAARDRLYAKHGVAMRRAGTAHRFLLVSAQRRLRTPGAGGRWHVLAALCERPLSLRLWAWMAYALLPWSLRSGLRRVRWGRRLNAPASVPVRAATGGG